jgi:predicted GNAT family acetyltransferase
MSQTAGRVAHNADAQQFEMALSGGKAVLQYRLDGDRIDLLHTKVPPEDEGSGHGTSLVRAAFDHARRSNLRVVPTCPFVKAYVEKHPEEAELAVDP